MKDHCINPNIKCNEEDCKDCIWNILYSPEMYWKQELYGEFINEPEN